MIINNVKLINYNIFCKVKVILIRASTITRLEAFTTQLQQKGNISLYREE